MVPTVSCETRMKEIELKEICIDIDIQLPREECKQEEREDCRSKLTKNLFFWFIITLNYVIWIK